MFGAFMFVLGIAVGMLLFAVINFVFVLFMNEKIVYADNVVTGCPHVDNSENEE